MGTKIFSVFLHDQCLVGLPSNEKGRVVANFFGKLFSPKVVIFFWCIIKIVYLDIGTVFYTCTLNFLTHFLALKNFNTKKDKLNKNVIKFLIVKKLSHKFRYKTGFIFDTLFHIIF